MVTLKDIARQCGVSVASVSKALNNMPGVGPKTAQRIREVAKVLGYQPNAAAQALKTNRSFNIGVLLEDHEQHSLLHHFFVRVLEGFKVVMELQGYDLMLLNRTIGKRTVSYLQHCRHSNLDGVFVACFDFGHPELLELAASGVPLVSIDHTYPNHPSVYSDNVHGVHTAVRNAIKLGHKKIAFITGGPAGVTSKRLEGYKKALLENGITPNEQFHVFSRYRDVERTKQATRQLLKLKDRPTCILMPDDHAALGGLAAIREAGLQVPDDVSVIGFDGLPHMEYVFPRLSTVSQDAMTIGEEAAKLLLEHINNKNDDKINRAVKVPITFIQGETLAPPTKP